MYNVDVRLSALKRRAPAHFFPQVRLDLRPRHFLVHLGQTQVVPALDLRISRAQSVDGHNRPTVSVAGSALSPCFRQYSEPLIFGSISEAYQSAFLNCYSKLTSGN
jgi:hypothetical protein